MIPSSSGPVVIPFTGQADRRDMIEVTQQIVLRCFVQSKSLASRGALAVRGTPPDSDLRCALNLMNVDLAQMEHLLKEMQRPMPLPRVKSYAAQIKSLSLKFSQRVERVSQELEKMPVPAAETAPIEPLPTEHRTCAWHECGLPARESSKYCSRSCSNKNAHWRAKQR